MLEDIAAMQARIQEIQERIASLSTGANTTPAVVPEPGSAQGAPSFAAALHQAQGPPTPVEAPASEGGVTSGPEPAGVTVPPASLGPLPPMPVSPTASNIVPIHTASTSQYEDLIQSSASEYGLSPDLIRAVIHTESGGNPHAVSRAGAMGLMQLMPENVKEAGINDAFDPAQNISAGSKQLSDLLKMYHGNVDLALAGYNAGPGNVRKYGGVPPFTETQNYIRKVRAAMGKE